MSYILGKVKTKIYEGSAGYKVGLFKITDTDDEELLDKVNKTISFNGFFADLNTSDTYKFYGNYEYKEKYGYGFRCGNYEVIEPTGKDAVIEFLTSSLVKGCGEKTATKIVETLGEDALNIIKEDRTTLLQVPGLTLKKANSIYESIILISNTDSIIVELKEMGFSIKDALLIIEKFGYDSILYVKNNIYELKEFIDFDKLDHIYTSKIGDLQEDFRIRACIIETIEFKSFRDGDIYFTSTEIYETLNKKYGIYLEEEDYYALLTKMNEDETLVVKDDKYYLKKYYDMEIYIANKLCQIKSQGINKISKIDELIRDVEDEFQVLYNKNQKEAIKNALENRVTIISGGPGTGKTTIISAIVKIYVKLNNLKFENIESDIALLSPTGRASKKMMDSTGVGAMTIHRYLKWNKESNDFQIDEMNKNNQKLIIIDEVSMVDLNLFDALLKGINTNITLVFVGDKNQLPSVGAGNVLGDLIKSESFTFCPLEKIYRQSDNSYIPILAQEIREKSVSDLTSKKDDYNFLISRSSSIKDYIKQVVLKSIEKGHNEKTTQILAPIYRGNNGIDSLNKTLQSIYNPPSDEKLEVLMGEIIYREGDKILQLVNNLENNVFNGDIGYIEKIRPNFENKKKINFIINFDGNKLEYQKEEMRNVKHAYAMTVHKAQGSEFPNVIMPISREYSGMLYNRLLYTGISRAKNNLIIIGDETFFLESVDNDYSEMRKTSLSENIMNIIK